jgi:hypothetical protein
MKTLFSITTSSHASCRPSIGERAIALLCEGEQPIFSSRLFSNLSKFAESAVLSFLRPASGINSGINLAALQGWLNGDRRALMDASSIHTLIIEVLDHKNPPSGRDRQQPDPT